MIYNGIEGEDYNEVGGILVPDADVVANRDSNANFTTETGINRYSELAGFVGTTLHPDGQQLKLFDDPAVKAQTQEESTALVEDYAEFTGASYHGDSIDFRSLLESTYDNINHYLYVIVPSVAASPTDDMTLMTNALWDYLNVQNIALIKAESEAEYDAIWQETVETAYDMGFQEHYDFYFGYQHEEMIKKMEMVGDY